jgi:hypothetical protein
MVGVLSLLTGSGCPYFNVMMSSGKHGNIEFSSTKEIKMNKSEPVAKISVY